MESIINENIIENWIKIIQNSVCEHGGCNDKSCKEYLLDRNNELIEEIKYFLPTVKNLSQNLYYTNPDIDDDTYIKGRTIIGYLIWLIRDTYNEFKDISLEAENIFKKLLDFGFDPNKTETIIDGKNVKLITPITELMNIDGFEEDHRYKLLEKLKNFGADFSKTNVWCNNKTYNKYLCIYEEWNIIQNLDNRIIKLFN